MVKSTARQLCEGGSSSLEDVDRATELNPMECVGLVNFHGREKLIATPVATLGTCGAAELATARRHYRKLSAHQHEAQTPGVLVIYQLVDK